MRHSLVTDGTPITARSLGFGERFRYWKGASDRRYLFSAVSQGSLDDLTDVVVLMTSEMPNGQPSVAWVGEIDERGHLYGRALTALRGSRTRVFVHFLASSEAERKDIVRDLTEAA